MLLVDMAVAYQQALLTRTEYEGLVRRGVLDDARVELLYGRLVSMSPQGAPHTFSVSQLMTLLVRALGDQARVRVQAPFVAPDESEPQPDLAVVPPGHYLDGHPRTAYLVVEVSESSLARDRSKARLYAAAGVDEYWIVNLTDGVLEVYREPGSEGYGQVTRYARGSEVRPVRFPALAVKTADVLPPEHD
jgi:Uma2 family endonuclease